MLNDLVMLHNIFDGHSVVKFPQYLTHVTDNERGRLRSNVRPPQGVNQSNSPDFSVMRSRQLDNTSLRSGIGGNANAFKNTFFFRTHTIWNDLTVPLREIVESIVFQVKLKEFMWEQMINPH